MEDIIYCRSCLVTDVRMHTFDTMTPTVSLGEIYSGMLQTSTFCETDYVCFECARLLQKWQDFKSKCIRAHHVLESFKSTQQQISKSVLLSIARNENKLGLNLNKSPIDIIDNSNNGLCNTVKNELEVKMEKMCFETEVKYSHKIENSINDFYIIPVEEFGFVNEISKDNTNSQNKNIKKRKRNVKTKKRKLKIPNSEYENDDSIENNLTDDDIKKLKRNEMTKETKIEIAKSEFENDGSFENNLSDDETLNYISKVDSTKKIIYKKITKTFNMSYFEDYANVVFLTAEDAKREHILKKEAVNFQKLPYKCEFCYKGYETIATYENHMQRHTSAYGEYECVICHLRFPKKNYLGKHMLNSHKRKFSCKLCPYVCYCTEQAKTHIELHKGKKYPCEECGQVFSMPNTLYMHKRMKHLAEVICEFCGGTFTSAQGLLIHTIKLHKLDENKKLGPKCDDCDIHFATDAAWKRHLVLSSKHTVNYGCKFCGETFTNDYDLKRHLRIHARPTRQRLHSNVDRGHKKANDHPPICDICQKTFLNRREFKSHVISEHPDSDIAKKLSNKDETNYVCEICGVTFNCQESISNRKEYKSHVISEHPDSDIAKKLSNKDETNYVCEICGVTFNQRCLLKYHLSKHNGDRPYKCKECGKGFHSPCLLYMHKSVHRQRAFECKQCGRILANGGALRKHMKMHLGIRPHKCVICNKTFISRCDMKLHVKYVHEKVPWPKRNRRKPKPNCDNFVSTDN